MKFGKLLSCGYTHWLFLLWVCIQALRPIYYQIVFPCTYVPFGFFPSTYVPLGLVMYLKVFTSCTFELGDGCTQTFERLVWNVLSYVLKLLNVWYEMWYVPNSSFTTQLDSSDRVNTLLFQCVVAIVGQLWAAMEAAFFLAMAWLS